ncbi:GGDEF domain-containing protein [Evansella sp. AB-rgal1]|uniref:GGDEF domain-containing protein n=1 Tax=Evansella sp. AB-rgal1 TaxID=3242696 RepID=UPI00359E9FE8
MILLASSVSYSFLGAFIATGLSIILFYFYGILLDGLEAIIIASYLLFSIVVASIFRYLAKSRNRFYDWQKQFYLQSKNLHVLREVSLALQSTLNIEKLLHIFLTSITAGYGLGFNRAMLFLQNQDGTFTGKLGIGPLTVEQGHTIWEDVVINKFTLKDFIQLQEKAIINDHKLNQKIRSFSFNVSIESPLLQQIVKRKEAFIVEENNGSEDAIILRLRETFKVRQLAMIPLLSRGKTIGILMIDNIVNQKPIHYEDVDNIVPLATQTAMAIENATLYEKTENMAITDGLTGLHNKRFMDRMLPHLYESAKSNHETLSVLVLDLDSFKVYNDTHGHLLGNEVLIQLSSILKKVVGAEDFVCRFGGEEFVILLPKKTLPSAMDVGEEIRLAVRNHAFPKADSQPKGRITVSIGVACSTDDTPSSIDSLLDRADKALYKAKEFGKDRVFAHEEGVDGE